MKKILFVLLLISCTCQAQELGIYAAAKPAVVAFSPTDLTPTSWWDSRSSDIASDGSSWTDRMGHYNWSESGSVTYNSSALNGRPGLDFTGSNEMSIAGISEIVNQTGLTIIMVGKRGAYAQDAGGTSNNIEFAHYFSNDFIYGVYSGGGYNHGSVSITNAFHYDVSIFDGTLTGNSNRLKIYVDGVQKTLTFSGTIPANTSTTITTSHMGSFSGVFNAGTMCELIIVPRAITGTELTNINSYLSTKYGL
jgi:hypothetical protein